MRTILRTLVVVLAAAAVLPAAGAQTADKAVVNLADLDMTAPGSGDTLLQRIRAAAYDVCIAPGYNTRTTVFGCTRDVVASTVKRLGMPALTTAWNDSGPRQTLLASR